MQIIFLNYFTAENSRMLISTKP